LIARASEPIGRLVRMRLATTSTAAAGGRPKTTEVGLLAGRGGAGGKGEETFELVSGAAGAEHLTITPHKLFETVVAAAAAIVVDRHVRSFAEDQSAVKRTDR
jgi:hypothetical protein